MTMFQRRCATTACADEPMQTCRKIVNWRQYLRFPEEVAVPRLARDLICRLLCDVETRLGSHGGAPEIKVNTCLALVAFEWLGG